MISRNLCLTDNKTRELYPFDETIILWTEGGSTVDGSPLVRTLNPVTSIEVLTNRNEIFVQSIEFAGYDTADDLLEKDEDEVKEYANEIVRGSMLSASWQPNYFRPIVNIMGVNLTSNIHSGDLSIGLPMPYCLNINKVISTQTEKNIDVRAALCQRSPDGFRNYPVLAILNFWHNNK
jgi:hypothetical protein